VCSFATPSDQITLLIRKHVELLDRLIDCGLFVRLTADNSDQLRRRAAELNNLPMSKFFDY